MKNSDSYHDMEPGIRRLAAESGGYFPLTLKIMATCIGWPLWLILMLLGLYSGYKLFNWLETNEMLEPILWLGLAFFCFYADDKLYHFLSKLWPDTQND